MERLSPSDLDRVLRFVRDLSAVEQLSQFPARVVEGLRQLVPCDLIGYNEINRAQGSTVMVLQPSLDASGIEGQKAFARLADQHPVLRYHARTREGRALTISDFMSDQEFHRTDLYAESFRLIGAEDQLAVALPAPPPLVIGVALNRNRRSFSQRDRQLLDLVRPHLATAHRNAALRSQLAEMVVLLERLVDDANRAIILIDRGGTVRLTSGHAAELLVAYMNSRIGPGTVLPGRIGAWLRTRQEVESLEDGPVDTQPLVIDGEQGRLVIRFLPRGEIGEYDALLVDQARNRKEAAPLSRLSPREYEVLGWVARGKTNPQIAEILSLSAGTVQKHLEHIYDKLGVRTRAAAAVALAGGRDVAPPQRPLVQLPDPTN